MADKMYNPTSCVVELGRERRGCLRIGMHLRKVFITPVFGAFPRFPFSETTRSRFAQQCRAGARHQGDAESGWSIGPRRIAMRTPENPVDDRTIMLLATPARPIDSLHQ